MNGQKSLNLALSLLFALATTVYAGDNGKNRTKTGQETVSEAKAYLKSLVGSWEGTCRTWFRPGELADESTVQGEFRLILGGLFLRHTYKGELQGKPRAGEEMIAFNSVEKKFQTSWVDDYHMNYGILFSEGNRTETGFVVVGSYAVGAGQPAWGWKTVFEMIDKDHITITAYNLTPDGREGKAVETKYTRKKP